MTNLNKRVTPGVADPSHLPKNSPGRRKTETTDGSYGDAQLSRIEKIWGYDCHLYELIAPFVMNPEVIRLNGGSPFKNTEDHLWYISVKGKNMVTGFLSVCDGHICNDFTWQDKDLLRILIERALMDIEKGTPVTFVADYSQRPLLEEMGFSVQKEWAKYLKMAKIR